MRCRGVRPGIVERLEASSDLANSVERVEQVPRRSGEPVELAHHQRVAFAQRCDGLCELGPVAVRTTDLLCEYPGATAGMECFSLCSQCLTIGAHSGVSYRCHSMLPFCA